MADLAAGRWAGSKGSKGASVLVTMLTGDSKVPPSLPIATFATQGAQHLGLGDTLVHLAATLRDCICCCELLMMPNLKALISYMPGKLQVAN